MSAIREEQPLRPATWEGSIHKILREMVDQHRELRGATLQLVETRSDTLIVAIEPNASWSRRGRIPRTPLSEVTQGCAALTTQALAARQRLPKGLCPGCQGSISGLCRQCGEAQARGPQRASLPAGWSWDVDPAHTYKAEGPQGWMLLETTGVEAGLVRTPLARCVPPGVVSALWLEAQRLGLPWKEHQRHLTINQTDEILCISRGSPTIGTKVVLDRHTPVRDMTFWNDAMEPFVGRTAVITELMGADPADCLMAKVDIDGGRWSWRIRNMRLL